MMIFGMAGQVQQAVLPHRGICKGMYIGNKFKLSDLSKLSAHMGLVWSILRPPFTLNPKRLTRGEVIV
jgi:hypothetical protein